MSEGPSSTTPSVDVTVIAARLAAPFEPAEVKLKPQTVRGNRALAVSYVDARVVQDRLDDVVGVMGWQDSYEFLPGGSVLCRLRLKVAGEWITKEDVGSESAQPDEGDRKKAAVSDALKRAAVKFGVGRYLYRRKPQWLDYDPQTKQFTGAATPPRKGQAPPPRQAPRPAGPPAAPVEPHYTDQGDDEIVQPDQAQYLNWLLASRGWQRESPKLCQRFGVATLGELAVKEYRFARDELAKLPQKNGAHP